MTICWSLITSRQGTMSWCFGPTKAGASWGPSSFGSGGRPVPNDKRGGRMPRIFISHIHEDKQAADHLVAFLRVKLNVQPEDLFLSSNKTIQLGSQWLVAIS